VAANLIANGSFESPAANATWAVAPGGSYSYISPTYWQATARAGPSKPTTLAFPLGAPDGLQIGFTGDDVSPGTLFQNVPAALEAGITYTVSGLVGSRLDYAGSGIIFLATASGSVLAGSGSISPPLGTFSEVSFSFSPLANEPRIGQQLRVVLQRSGGHQANFDDIRLTMTPEPASFVNAFAGLVAMGCFGPALRRRNS
jgi:hypothetical protein